MKNTKRFVILAIATILIMSLGIAIPVNADTYVDVDTTGNVQLIINTDGTVNLIYNKVNIHAEINGLKAVLSSMNYRMNTLATKTEVSNLNQTVYKLIGELDEILDDLYGRTNYLASVVGLQLNSSSVAINLKEGEATISGYLDSIIETLDSVTSDIETLDNKITSVYDELQEFENYVDGKFSVVDENFNQTYVDMETELNRLYKELHNEVQTLEKETSSRMEGDYEELDQKREELREAVLSDLQMLLNKIEEGETRQEQTDRGVQNLQSDMFDVQEKLYHYEIFIYLLAIGVAFAIVLVVYVAKSHELTHVAQNPHAKSSTDDDETDSHLRARAKSALKSEED